MYKSLPLFLAVLLFAGCCHNDVRGMDVCYSLMWNGVHDMFVYPVSDPPISGYDKFVVPELHKNPHAVVEHLIVNIEISGYDDRRFVGTDTGLVFADEAVISHWILDRCLEHDMNFFPDDIYDPACNRHSTELYYINKGANRQRIAKMWREYWEKNKSRMEWDDEARQMRFRDE